MEIKKTSTSLFNILYHKAEEKWVVTILLALPGVVNNIKSLNERKKSNEEKATKLPSRTKK